MITNTEFRNAMSKLVSAVHIVTTDGESGRHGFTASAVCSVTDTPPTLLVCMNGNARSYEHFVKNQVLCVNTLAADQAELSNAFASAMSADERFAQAEWTTLATGAPVLTSSLVSFDCKIDQIETVGTHSIFICKIIAIKQGDGAAKGLAYCDRAYHSVVAQG
ncbi:flavin reductase [Moraxella sp. FZLJ2107]|uniref:flavin reductase n=1 Tax=unclassified Moraxella TaxID=2685852 RepID=UPI0020C8D467|nr:MULTISPECIES: flavin reductase [unclassified Moraxella]UTO05890.1 flavin reductase [Moraxella sp. FZLJ2107]UTO22626.1 flavin reductase [Moraxella sp. FZLJ2109]